MQAAGTGVSSADCCLTSFSYVLWVAGVRSCSIALVVPRNPRKEMASWAYTVFLSHSSVACMFAHLSEVRSDDVAGVAALQDQVSVAQQAESRLLARYRPGIAYMGCPSDEPLWERSRTCARSMIICTACAKWEVRLTLTRRRPSLLWRSPLRQMLALLATAPVRASVDARMHSCCRAAANT